MLTRLASYGGPGPRTRARSRASGASARERRLTGRGGTAPASFPALEHRCIAL